MVEIKKLGVTYPNGVAALKDVDLSVEKGEILCIIGPSGCGKSTLLSVLGGILKAHSGTVAIEGKPLDVERQTIGFMPQGYGLMPWKTVYKNCVLPYRIKKRPISEVDDRRLDAILASLDLDKMKKRYPRTLSGGQRQRVAIARALFLQPELLLMDEPFSALDAIMREEAQQLFLKTWRQVKCATLIVTHSIEEALYLGHKIVVMRHAPGGVRALMENPLFGREDFREAQTYSALYKAIKVQLMEEVARGQ